MSGKEQLQRLDEQRRRAMIAADADALNRLLADDMIWTHSSGVTETKAQFVAAIVEQRVVYNELEIEQDQVRRLGTELLHYGIVKGSASREGQAKPLCAKFLAVWHRVGDGVEDNDVPMQLIAWQSTNCTLPTA